MKAANNGRHPYGWLLLLVLLLAGLSACGGEVTGGDQPTTAAEPVASPAEGASLTAGGPHADVTAVAVSGQPGAYRFAVTISSPDTGCDQFADWWEVLALDGESGDGELLYRRVLLHSHVDEQPFTRSGGPVDVSADTIVIIRAHMSTDGYGGVAMQGSVTDGFEPVVLEPGFAADVAGLPPLPEGCAY